MSKPQNIGLKYGEIDKITLWIVAFLSVIGWLMIYAANYKPADSWAFLDFSHSAGKQLFTMIVCAIMMFVVQQIDWTFWRTFAWVFYGVSLILQIGVFFFGKVVNGARIWYEIGSFSFQPSELVKFSTCLAMANLLTSINFTFGNWRQKALMFLVFLLPAGIILKEDTGSAIVFLSFFLLLFREGLSSNLYVIGVSAATLVILGLIFDPVWVIVFLTVLFNAWLIFNANLSLRWWLFLAFLIILSFFWGNIWGKIGELQGRDLWNEWSLGYAFLILHAIFLGILFNKNYRKKNAIEQRPVLIGLFLFVLGSALAFGANYFCFHILKPHQQTRIKVWLRPQECDPRGELYNINHSKMAIGSGGLSGKGFLEGNMTKLRFVPEQNTDFIFCTVGEEQGFLGVFALISLFCILLWRISVIAERQRTDFSRRYAYGVLGVFFIHFLINIGMTMGLFPIIGIPLPFISYGGSSLIGFSLMIAVLLKLDSSQRERN